jgi:hypothetical protein
MTSGKAKGSFGSPALKYIKQVGHELMLGRELMCDRETRPTSWGDFAELVVFDLLPLSYRNVSGVRYFHPTLPWSGSPDFIQVETVGDCKAPFNLEVFCDKIDALQTGIEKYREDFPEDYYQHISNAILLNENGLKITHLEAIVYVPFRSELEHIRSVAQHAEDRFKWICFASDDELPWIPDGGHYTNLNRFRFEIPNEDKIALHTRIVEAGKLLVSPKLITA